jgi:glyoxylase-like metal-dependent hydrolase (beta-lactamase superfamily II)
VVQKHLNEIGSKIISDIYFYVVLQKISIEFLKMNESILKIVSTRVGYSNSVLLVNGSNSIIIDTGVRGNLRHFKTLFNHYKLNPFHIKLIILTHTHYDHTGNLKALAEFTCAKVLVHKTEFENLKKGFTPIPTGQGTYSRLISKLGRIVYPKYASPKPFVADMINEGEFDLKEFGIEGKIISTPGHTEGSQSVLLGKKLISGDTFINLPNGIIFPHFANDPKTLLETWQKLFDLGVQEIYPGHGKPFKVEKAVEEFERWKTKLLILKTIKNLQLL